MPKEYDTYPQPTPKPKIKIDWDDVGYWFATWGLAILLVGLVLWGLLSIIFTYKAYDEWKFGCVSQGNMVVEKNGPDYCVADARVLSTNPEAKETAKYFTDCLASGGYLGTIYSNGYMCVAGRVVSQF